jgi:hypothetical protein
MQHIQVLLTEHTSAPNLTKGKNKGKKEAILTLFESAVDIE